MINKFTMKKITIKDIIKFRNKSDKNKKNFVSNLKLDPKKNNPESGGDYWISCLTAISNSYKLDNLQFIINKRDELDTKNEETDYKRTKLMYQRNLDILSNFEDFDFKKWRPTESLKFIKKHKDNSILMIKGLPIQVSPHHIFTFQKNDIQEMGAIWFIAKLNGFTKNELGMFADILFQNLKTNFSNKYNISSKYCIAVDVFNNFDVNYSQLETGEISPILNLTLDEIKKLM